MRLLMTTDAVGGVWQYSLALARGLADLFRFRVLLVCFGEPNRKDMEESGLASGVDLVTLKLKLEWMPDSAGDIDIARRELLRLARDWRAELLHSNQFCFGSLDTVAPRLVVAHSDLLGWITWHRRGGEYDESELLKDPSVQAYSTMVSRGLAGASAVVSPSKFMAQHMDEAYGCPSEVIHNGLWPDLYHHGAKEPVAVVSGRLWDEAKMAVTAVEATEGLPIQLRLIGSTEGPSGERASLPETANATYLGSLGWRETREEVSAAQFYLATSSYEPFGLSVLEAAFSGCAVVVNEIPSFRELWRDSVSYYRHSAESLREKLDYLLKRPDESNRLAKAARSRATERFTAQRMATQYYRLYRAM